MMTKSVLISYVDFLTCLFTIFVVLFILSSDNKEKTKGNMIDPSAYLVEMTWTDNSTNDIDLWMENPNGEIVFYHARELGGMTLDTDNMGINNYLKNSEGEMVSSPARREVASIRTVLPGVYTVNVLYYGDRTGAPENVKVHVFGLNPYNEVIEKTVTLHIAGEENTIVQFELDKDGNLMSKDDTQQVSLFAKVRL